MEVGETIGSGTVTEVQDVTKVSEADTGGSRLEGLEVRIDCVLALVKTRLLIDWTVEGPVTAVQTTRESLAGKNLLDVDATGVGSGLVLGELLTDEASLVTLLKVDTLQICNFDNILNVRIFLS